MTMTKNVHSIRRNQQPDRKCRKGPENPERVQGLKGSRLHARRIATAPKLDTSPETMKYPLIGRGADGEAAERQIIDAIIHDNRALYGAMGFEDHIDGLNSGEDEYSFVGFWLECLAEGAFFASQNAVTIQHSRIAGEANEELDSLFDAVDDELKPLIDRDAWDGFMKQDTPRKVGGAYNERTLRNGVLATLELKWDAAADSPAIKAPKGRDPLTDDELEMVSDRLDDYVRVMVDTEDHLAARSAFFGIPREALDRRDDSAESGAGKGVKVGYGFDHAFDVESYRTVLETEGRTAFLDLYLETVRPARARLVVNKQGKEEWKENWPGAWPGTMGLLEKGKSINAMFSLHAALLREGPVGVAAKLGDKFDYDEPQRHDIERRLTRLARYAIHLPESPELIHNWGDYRADVFGTLSSWLSNRDTKLATSRTNRESIAKESATVRAVLAGADSPLARDVEDALGRLLVVVAEAGEDREGTDAIRFAQSELRIAMNDFKHGDDTAYKATFGKRPDNKSATDNGKKKDKRTAAEKAFDIVVSKVQSAPLFFGEGAREGARRDWNWRSYLTEHLDTILSILDESLADGQDAMLEAPDVRALGRTANNVSHNAIKESLATLGDALGCVLTDEGKRDGSKILTFHLSPYVKRPDRYRRLDSRSDYPIAEAVKDANLRQVLVSLREATVSDRVVDHQLLRDAGDLAKVLVSAAATATGQTREERARLVDACSGIGGIVRRISHSCSVARYQAQAGNGAQVTLARTVVRRNDVGQIIGARYGYTFPEASLPAREDEAPARDLWHFDGAKKGEWVTPVGAHAKAPVLDVCSSRHQVQFLDWFGVDLELPSRLLQNKGGVTATPQGPFCIAEEDTRIDWSGHHPVVRRLDNVHVEPKKAPAPVTMNGRRRKKRGDRHHMKGRRRRVYVSQPFAFELPARSAEEIEGLGQKGNGQRYIGVDIGEYALAWYIVEVVTDENGDPCAFNKVAYGELVAPGHNLLANRVKRNRARQVKATFNSPDTYIARLRKDIAHWYRNRLHSLCLEREAIPVFEHEVDRFESGGNRDAKLYASIKRADACGNPDTDAHRADRKAAWGAGRAEHGVTVAAAGTSQRCTACGRWYNRALDGEADVPDRWFGDIRFWVRNEASMKHVTLVRGEKNNVKPSQVKEAMRPAHYHEGFAHARDRYDTAALAEFTQRRGNSAIYVCPYDDCRHEADADIQAALNIAIRGAIKDFVQSGIGTIPKPRKPKKKKEKAEAEAEPPENAGLLFEAVDAGGVQTGPEEKEWYPVSWFDEQLDRIGYEACPTAGLDIKLAESPDSESVA